MAKIKLCTVYLSQMDRYKVGVSAHCACLGVDHCETGLLPINISLIQCL